MVNGRTRVLTPKEREVLSMLVSGLTVREIAAQTGRHPSTVYELLARVRERLGARTDAELATVAVRTKLIESDGLV